MLLQTEIPNEVVRAQQCLRPLGSFEEVLLKMDQRSPLHATLTAHVDGLTTIDEWRIALEQARLRHPLWSATIDANAGSPFFQTRRDAYVPLRIVKANSLLGWEDEIARELSEAIDAARDSPVRAVLMHTPSSCMFLLSAHHSICDGMSLAFAIRDVLQALSGSRLEKLGVHASEEETFGLVSQGATTGISDGVQPPVATAVPSVYRMNSSRLPQVQSLQMSSTFTQVLRKRARQEKTTVHAALMAAAGTAARKTGAYGKGRDLHICSTISNRALMGSPEDCCVLFTACDFVFGSDPAEDFWDIARAAKEIVRTAQSDEGVKALLGAVSHVVQSCADAAACGEAGARLFQFDIHVSNLGAVSIPTSYGSLWLRQLWGPAVLVGFEGEQVLGVSTVNGRLCLLHTSHSPLDEFLTKLDSILNAACSA
jgi:hypothetical protein